MTKSSSAVAVGSILLITFSIFYSLVIRPSWKDIAIQFCLSHAQKTFNQELFRDRQSFTKRWLEDCEPRWESTCREYAKQNKECSEPALSNPRPLDELVLRVRDRVCRPEEISKRVQYCVVFDETECFTPSFPPIPTEFLQRLGRERNRCLQER